jgi:starch synthase (maltosyl-transferring)
MPPKQASRAQWRYGRGVAKTNEEYLPVIGRIPILALSPAVDGGLWPAKAFSGEVLPFRATAFREGHDIIGADLILIDPAGTQTEHRMRPLTTGTDRWEALAQLEGPGLWQYRIRAYGDDFATWLHNAELKVPAGVDVELMFTIGTGLLSGAASDGRRSASERRLLADAAKRLADTTQDDDARLSAVSD